jgi:hypothetical protein
MLVCWIVYVCSYLDEIWLLIPLSVLALQETIKYSLILIDEYTYETDEFMVTEKCNTTKYNNLYSSIPRNKRIYLSVMYIRHLHITNEFIEQLTHSMPRPHVSYIPG